MATTGHHFNPSNAAIEELRLLTVPTIGMSAAQAAGCSRLGILPSSSWCGRLCPSGCQWQLLRVMQSLQDLHWSWSTAISHRALVQGWTWGISSAPCEPLRDRRMLGRSPTIRQSLKSWQPLILLEHSAQAGSLAILNPCAWLSTRPPRPNPWKGCRKQLWWMVSRNRSRNLRVMSFHVSTYPCPNDPYPYLEDHPI